MITTKSTHGDVAMDYKVYLTPKQAQAMELQRQGLKYWQIAEELDITPEAVSARIKRAKGNILKATGVVIPKKTVDGTKPTPREAEVLRLKRKGFPRRCIAELLGISVMTVKRHLNKANKRIRLQEQ